jgi:phage terminase Nu1 subunit (DNA packaging protein)
MSEERLLTEAELLAALNIQADRTAVWRWRQQGMPYVKVGRSPRYDLEAVRQWFQRRTAPAGQWDWSVWTWVPESRLPSGETEPAFWYEECRCRNQADAENIAKLFRMAQPGIPVRASTTKPEEIPEEVLR